ncbi:hypothetical protein WMY93_006297 [Mugilogobius chulae]|uniref:Uncharacterized protein n=1 Tax=Mugilogobius chulae TaxID=88201 RepID=A0AAW0PJG6_9GOBI
MDCQAQTIEQEPLESGEYCTKEVHAEPFSFLTDVTLAPLCGTGAENSCTCDTCCCQEERVIDPDLQAVNMQLHFFINKADNIQKTLSELAVDREAYAASMQSFLFTCQPFFNHLEQTARSPLSDNFLLSESKRSQLFDFSQTLCNKLENLLLTCAGNNLLSLDETEPDGLSHFYIGQCGLGPLRVTFFRYCQLTPYLAEVNTGLFKRMRWNVDQLGEMDNTEYYFLCCEDVNTLPEEDSSSSSQDSGAKMWSIGQWIQVSPETDNINDWIICSIPQGTYLKRVILGSEEPTCSIATDCLLQLLMLDHK